MEHGGGSIMLWTGFVFGKKEKAGQNFDFI